MTDIFLEGGRALIGTELVETSLSVAGTDIARVDAARGRARLAIDARNLLVLPGIVDLHGDAFERQMMPRAGVDFPIDVALADSDRQAISNGITTVFHATTCSWEPGLRSADNARGLMEAIERQRPQFAADTRFHLRHETYNLDAEAEISQWLAEGRVDLFAFNDHMDGTVADMAKPRKRNRMVERTGLSSEDFDGLVDRVISRPPTCRPPCRGSLLLPARQTCGCSRMTMRHPRCAGSLASSALTSPSFRSTRRRRGRQRATAMPSSTARRTSCAAAATPAGPGHPT
ncbi:phosphonate metabolism protein PhnM [Bradyrhizobium diazoefficiens]